MGKAFVILLCYLVWLDLCAQNYKSPLEAYDSIVAQKDLDAFKQQRLLDSLIKTKNNGDIINQNKLAQIYRALFLKYYREAHNIEKTIECGLKIKVIGEEIKDTSYFYSRNHKNLVTLFYGRKQYNEAIIYGKSYIENYPNETVNQAKVYRLLGNAYNDLGDFDRAISNYNKAIFILRNNNNSREEGRTLINLLEVYIKIDSRQFKKEIYQIRDRMDAICGEDEMSQTDIMKKDLNLGAFYDDIDDFKNANERHTNALEIAKALSDSLYIIKSLINLGITSKKEKDLKRARLLFDDADPYIKNNNENRADLYNNIADLYKEAKDYDKALDYYDKAILEFLNVDALDLLKTQSSEIISASNDKVAMLDYFRDKADILLLINEKKHLELALKLYELCDLLLDVIYFESKEEFSKLFWREQASVFYLNATEVAYLLNLPEVAFYFIEKSKALLLLENIITSKAKTLAELPDQIITKEYQLISRIKRAEEQLFAEGEFRRNSDEVDSLKNEVFINKRNYKAFIDSLETVYPRYYNYKRNITVYDAEMTRKSLQDNELVLQYKLGTDKAFVVLISKLITKVYSLGDVSELYELMDTYASMIKRPFVDLKDQQDFIKTSNTLYLKLFPFISHDVSALVGKKLIVVPEGRLNFLPFESLVVDQKKTIEESYLINYADISYAYSCSSLNIDHHDNYENDFFVISPLSFSHSSLSDLPAAEGHNSLIEGVLNTKIISHKDASRERFLNEFGNFRVVHISTHGGLLNDKPWVAFNDDKLMLNDIYFKNQRADLVILSACKTSHGEIKKGEGIMSIARAFVNSGSKSVVSSLWNINKQSTDELIRQFYINLKKGDSKSEALRAAKMAYIKNHKNTSEASPFYWSSLILIGDSEPVFEADKKWMIAALMFGIGVIIFLFLRWKSKRNTN